jgi:purine-binding chemotaxis protein CheW
VEPTRHFVYLHRGLQFAVPVAEVLEVVETTELRPTHISLPACIGNITHRKRLIPVLESAGLVRGPEPRPAGGPLMVVILRRDERFLGLTLERFVTVAGLDPPPGGGAAGDGFIAFVQGFRDNALMVLSTDRLAGALATWVGDQRVVRSDDDETPDAERQIQTEEVRRDFLCASLEGLVLGVPVEDVIEVIEDYDVTRLFEVTPMLRGLINLRGEVLACVDISEPLGFLPRTLQERSQFVVLRGDGGEVALCVDRVHRIRPLPIARMQEASAVLGEPTARFVSSVLETGEDTVFVLSVGHIFQAPELQPYMRGEP